MPPGPGVRSCVFDASAIVAIIWAERGHETLGAILESTVVHASAVNIAEAVGVLRAKGSSKTREELLDLIQRLGVIAEDFTVNDAAEVVYILEGARTDGNAAGPLSLADAVCLATAHRLSLPAVVSDSAWEQLNIGVEILPFR